MAINLKNRESRRKQALQFVRLRIGTIYGGIGLWENRHHDQSR